jgi:hypothetical protein
MDDQVFKNTFMTVLLLVIPFFIYDMVAEIWIPAIFPVIGLTLSAAASVPLLAKKTERGTMPALALYALLAVLCGLEAVLIFADKMFW